MKSGQDERTRLQERAGHLIKCRVKTNNCVRRRFELGTFAENSFASLKETSLLVMSAKLRCLFIRNGMYTVKCDADVRVEGFGMLCNVLRCICFMLL